MMAEQGIAVSHTTILHRWVIRYVPEFERRWNRFARPVNNSWRVCWGLNSLAAKLPASLKPHAYGSTESRSQVVGLPQRSLDSNLGCEMAKTVCPCRYLDHAIGPASQHWYLGPHRHTIRGSGGPRGPTKQNQR